MERTRGNWCVIEGLGLWDYRGSGLRILGSGTFKTGAMLKTSHTGQGLRIAQGHTSISII